MMKKVSNPIPAETLRKHTHLGAKCANVTRWSSTARMPERCMRIKDAVSQFDDPEVERLILTVSQYWKIEKLCDTFGDLDTVIKRLQFDTDRALGNWGRTEPLIDR